MAESTNFPISSTTTMASSTGEQINVRFFKKKAKARPTTTRKRSLSPTTSEPSTSKSQVVHPTKRETSNLLTAGSKRTSSLRDELDNSDAPKKDGPDVKWTAAGSHSNAAMDIIAGDEVEELLAKRRKKELEEAGLDDQDVPDDGQYRGQAAYKHHLRKTTEVSKAKRVGPQRSTNTIRTVTIIDYQPDVCKDYKETGYCGFGDTCKFLHDRGTYLAGWQLDKLAENPNKRVEDMSSDSDDSDEDVPFACLICRKHYTDPVVTRCEHYFCSACAIKRYAKTPKCLACGATTGGIFNRADKIIEKVNKKRKEKEEKEREGREVDGEGGTGPMEIEGLQNVETHDDSGSE